VKETPILYSAPMVRARAEGRKTQTRRIVTPKHFTAHGGAAWERDAKDLGRIALRPEGWRCYLSAWPGVSIGTLRCPFGHVFDRLWTRETWAAPHAFDHMKPSEIPPGTRIHYRADEPGPSGLLWRPSIFLPRWASRGLDEITDVRVQRLHEITLADARAEAPPACDTAAFHGDYLDSFRMLWDAINLDRAPWSSNPWVWAITFRRLNP